jgi:MFS family permease
VLGGALTEMLSWHWVFWVNVPIGIVLVPLAQRRLGESHGAHGQLDRPGIVLSGAGLFAVVWALVDAPSAGWGAPHVVASLACGGALLGGFVAWERRAPAPMLPLRFYASRAFAAAGGVTVVAYFGLLGALFLIARLLQTGLGARPLGAGLGMLMMTVPMAIAAPGAGALCDRLAARRLLTGALLLGALALGLLAAACAPGVTFVRLAPGLALLGVAAAALFAPLQSTMLGAVAVAEQGQASGAAIAHRELGGALGVAVLGAVFAAHGGSGSHDAFLAGVRPALAVAAVTLLAAAVVARALPRAGAVAQTRRASTAARSSASAAVLSSR